MGVIKNGVERFFHKGEEHFAPPRHLVVINPGEVHDGSSATEHGFIYRVAYLNADLVVKIAEVWGNSKGAPPFFKDPVIKDPKLGEKLFNAHVLLEKGVQNKMAAQTCFVEAVAELINRHAVFQKGASPRRFESPKLIKKALEQIRDRAHQNLSLDDLARQAGVSKYHFLRIFKESTGLPPHAYLVQQRVELAKGFIEKGLDLSQSALKAGFSDQAHMTRQFKGIFGVTPGAFRKSLFT
jgi:AraC-like DNA-binding protein